MKIQYNEDIKIPYVVVDDFYSSEELKEIWNEIEFLSSEDKLLSPEHTYTASYLDGELKKQNLGVFIDDLYLNRSTSNILKHTRKIFSQEFFDELEKLNYIFSFLKKATKDNTLLSYYRDGDFYKPHLDEFLFTAICFLYKEPKQFEGGEFIFTEHDITTECKNNRLILFPSNVRHEVSEVKIKTEEPWMGRYSITSLIGN
jgi:Rps23 Pro-64 3,4-dihydroxylase Tpa1-like proline 4-hydroxylase